MGKNIFLRFDQASNFTQMDKMNLIESFSNFPPDLVLKSRSISDFNKIWKDNYELLGAIAEKEREVEIELKKNLKLENTVHAYSAAMGHTTAMKIYATEGEINWRETIVCEKSGLNNRSRAIISLANFATFISPKSRIYLTECTTPLWSWFSSRYKNSVGSEYFGLKTPLGETIDGVRNEDLTSLTFDSDYFDCIMCFDVLEHIPNYRQCLIEMHRTLLPDGYALLTFPFRGNDTTLKRAAINPDGSVAHLAPPEYHGDPINPGGGILCFYHFGHDILEEIKDVGFRDVFVLWYWSAQKGNLGGLQPYIIAQK